MTDFFYTAIFGKFDQSHIENTFKSIYGWIPKTNAFLGINLKWPKFELPLTHDKFFLSWHTEQLDVVWLKSQAQKVYPSPIMVANDGNIDSSIFPDNVEFVRWITWGEQIQRLVDLFGICEQPLVPKYKISSLSFRVSQYKNFITAYLLQHAKHDEIILTYHKQIGKQEDLHDHPAGLPWLDSLDLSLLEPTKLNFKDNFDWSKNQAVSNGDWRLPPYLDAAVNLTNESFHYSSSILDGHKFLFPFPYLTEKTWKPLLAGRPFLCVGQFETYGSLSKLGLKHDFGFPVCFDSDPGDLTRIGEIFRSLDVILNKSALELYEQSLDSVQHNIKHIKNGDFALACKLQNEQSRDRILEFLSV